MSEAVKICKCLTDHSRSAEETQNYADVQSSRKIFILSRMIFLEHERSSKLADQTLTRQFRLKNLLT